VPGSIEDLERELDWLYGKDGVYPLKGVPCRCLHDYKSLGTLHGMNMGKGWVRVTTDPKCPHHGVVA